MTRTGIAILVALGLALAPRPAHARCANDCMPWPFEVLGAAVVIGIAGGYVAGTGYFVYRDATDERQSLSYGATELGVNGALSALWITGAYGAESTGERFVYSGLALTHGALALHGAWRTYDERTTLHLPDQTLAWVAGMGYAANTLIWTLNLGGEHERSYGIWEAAVNAPLALGLGYLAVDRARDGETRQAVLFGGMALASGALAGHGLKTAISPAQSPGLDLLGTDIAPTMVSDGRDVAPGLAASRTW